MNNKTIVKCDKCQEKFVRNWSIAKRELSKINDIHYWTEGKEIDSYHLVCRDCLKKIYQGDKKLISLMNDKKKRLMRNYINMGALDKNDKSL